MHSLKELNRVLKPGGKLIICDWGKATSKWMRLSFHAVQLLDGFKTTNDNVNGLMALLYNQSRLYKRFRRWPYQYFNRNL